MYYLISSSLNNFFNITLNTKKKTPFFIILFIIIFFFQCRDFFCRYLPIPSHTFPLLPAAFVASEYQLNRSFFFHTLRVRHSGLVCSSYSSKYLIIYILCSVVELLLWNMFAISVNLNQALRLTYLWALSLLTCW